MYNFSSPLSSKFNRFNVSRLFIGLFCMLSLALSNVAHSSTADAIAERITTQSNIVIEKLSALLEQGEIDRNQALEIIQTDISPLFDYEKLTRRAMGKYARKVKGEELTKVSQAFQLLLEQTYAGVLSKYNGQQVKVLEVKELNDGKQYLVGLEAGDGNQSVRIDYICEQKNDEYLISDVKVEGISLVTNYRRQFSSILKKSDTDTLVEQIHKLTEQKKS